MVCFKVFCKKTTYIYLRPRALYPFPVPGQSISELLAINNDFNEDRRWAFSCEANPAAVESCVWSDFTNDWDGVMDFDCPLNGFLTGWQSVHDNSKEDRRSAHRLTIGEI